MWYDLLVYDNLAGWLPVNIKTTTTKSSDNSGNLAICVYAYTNAEMNLNKNYCNSEMSETLIINLKNKKYDYSRRDYYFIVINKNNTKDIIINSVCGLSILTPNINNLPFQICWNKNRIYNYEHIYLKK